MKNTQPHNQTKLLIILATVLIAMQIIIYFCLMFRIQQGEERIYTDLHSTQMDILRMKDDNL